MLLYGGTLAHAEIEEGAWGRTWDKLTSQSPGPALCTSGHPFLHQCLLHLEKHNISCQVLSQGLVQNWVFSKCLLVSVRASWQKARGNCRSGSSSRYLSLLITPERISLPLVSPCCICTIANKALGFLGTGCSSKLCWLFLWMSWGPAQGSTTKCGI